MASFVRPGKLFTASEELVLSAVGILKREGFEKIVESIILLLRRG